MIRAAMVRGRKTTRGKQKIEIKRIEDEDARYISFSKRRNGIYAKASDLATLCGVEVAVVVFSPTGRPHSFGSPSVDVIIDRFLSGDPYRIAGPVPEIYQRKQVVKDLNQKLMEVARELDETKAERAVMEQRQAEAMQWFEWMDNLADVGLEEMDKMKEVLENIKSRAENRVRGHLSMASSLNPGGASGSGGGGSLWPASAGSSSGAFSPRVNSTFILERDGGGGRGGYANFASFLRSGSAEGGGRRGYVNSSSILGGGGLYLNRGGGGGGGGYVGTTSFHGGEGYVNTTPFHGGGGGYVNAPPFHGGGGGGGGGGYVDTTFFHGGGGGGYVGATSFHGGGGYVNTTPNFHGGVAGGYAGTSSFPGEGGGGGEGYMNTAPIFHGGVAGGYAGTSSFPGEGGGEGGYLNTTPSFHGGVAGGYAGTSSFHGEGGGGGEGGYLNTTPIHEGEGDGCRYNNLPSVEGGGYVTEASIHAGGGGSGGGGGGEGHVDPTTNEGGGYEVPELL